MLACSLYCLLYLIAQILLLFIAYLITFLYVLLTIIISCQSLLRPIFQLFHYVHHILLISNYWYHLFFDVFIYSLEPLSYVNVFGVLLDKTEYLLKDYSENSIMPDSLCVPTIRFTLNYLYLLQNLITKMRDILII